MDKPVVWEVVRYAPGESSRKTHLYWSEIAALREGNEQNAKASAGVVYSVRQAVIT